MALVFRMRFSRREWAGAVLVVGGMAAFVALVYAVVVLPAHVVSESTRPPSLVLSVTATAIVALGFGPVQTRVKRWARGVVHSDASSPYDVLRRFSQTVGGGYASEETPARMAKALAEGTRAEWAQVWLRVGDRLVLAATWPPSVPIIETPPEPGDRADDASGDGRRALPVRHEGKVLGVLRLQQRVHTRLSLVEERLFRGLATQAGLVLQTVKLEAELSQRLRELSQRSEELHGSRERLIETQDAERKKLERDIHDGAQQDFVALAVNLQLAAALMGDDPDRAAALLDEQAAAAGRAITTLTELSRGNSPHMLVEEGLPAALHHVATSRDLPVEVTAEPFVRPAARVEQALYFCCLEALQNAAKHAGASQVGVHIGPSRGGVHVSVNDDGDGFDAGSAAGGRGLINMRDRIDAVGGTVTIHSVPGRGTRVDLRVVAGCDPVAKAV